MLLQINQLKSALEAFELSQEVEPMRFRSIYSAAHSASNIEDKIKATSYYKTLLEIAALSNRDRIEIEEAQAFISN